MARQQAKSTDDEKIMQEEEPTKTEQVSKKSSEKVTKEWPVISFKLTDVIAISNKLLSGEHSTKLDKDEKGVFDYTGKERYALSKFMRWVRAEQSELFTEYGRRTSPEYMEETKKSMSDVNREWDEYVKTETQYKGPSIEVTEQFFDRVRLPADAIVLLGDFLSYKD